MKNDLLKKIKTLGLSGETYRSRRRLPEKSLRVRKLLIFSDISEQNNDYSDTLDFRRWSVGEVGVVTFFILEVPDYESAMLIYMYKKLQYRS